jgi:hypothetical protein
LLFAIPSTVATAQAPTADSGRIIDEVKFEGESAEQKLSAALRSDLNNLVGKPYDPAAVDRLVDRIQMERTDLVAEVKTQPGKQANQIRLVFEMQKLAEYISKSNANARYTVEAVEVEGVPRSKFSNDLYSDMQNMVGKPFDNSEADKLLGRLKVELQIDGEDVYGVSKYLRRGSMPDRVQVVFHAEKPANSYGFSFSNPGYHSKQGASGRVDTNYQHRDFGRVAFYMKNNADELLERQEGIGFAYSNRIEHLKLKVDYSSLRAKWTAETILASQQSTTVPSIYRLRDTLTPSAEYNLTKNLKVVASLSFSELQLEFPSFHFQRANTANGSLTYSRKLNDAQHFNASYSFENASHGIASDFVYTRHFWSAEYSVDPSGGRKTVKGPFGATLPTDEFTFSFLAGRITGNAPLFERFSLGNLHTLVGWNKFDIAPLGGSREAQFSASYRHTWLAVTYYTGTVWDQGQAADFHYSVAVTSTLWNTKICRMGAIPVVNFLNPICWPITVGFPIRRSNAQPILGLF